MTKEEDAIRILEAQASINLKENQYLVFHKEATETVLNKLKEKDKEIEKKDKQIDLMAEIFYKRFKAELLLEYGFESEEQLKQYFAGLVEKE